MGVVFLRRPLRYALLASLLVAGSAHASSCLSVAGYGDCGYKLPEVGGISAVRGPELAQWSPFGLQAWNVHRHDSDRQYDRRLIDRRHDDGPHGWTAAGATHHVREWSRQHDRDFDEFRRHWHRDRDHDGHHGGGGCHDDDLPKPVPLPGAALLFGPALLMLRAFQRRNA